MTTWNPESKEWLKNRKRSWQQIKKVLREGESVKNKNIKLLEKYYLTGEEPGLDEVDRIILFLHFKLWWHPDQSHENWHDIINKASKKEYEISREAFFQEVSSMHRFISEYGFMGGLEERMLEVFPSPLSLPQPKNLQGNIEGWFIDMSEWLTRPGSNPYFFRQYELESIFRNLKVLNEEDCKRRGQDPYYHFTRLLWQCAHFIDPRALPNEDTPQLRFVLKLREYLERSYLPDFLANIWKEVCTRDGRAKWWTHSIDHFRFDSEWDPSPFELNGFFTYMLHGERLNSEMFKIVHNIYHELGFAENGNFNKDHIERIDLSSALSPEMFPRVGYSKGEPIPALKYRINTNEEYVDNNEVQIDTDVILPLVPSSLEYDSDTPVLFLVPRPALPYGVTLSYKLNERMVRRLFQERTGKTFLRYLKVAGKVTDSIKSDPFYNCDYQPFKSGRKAIDTTNKECEFLQWTEGKFPHF